MISGRSVVSGLHPSFIGPVNYLLHWCDNFGLEGRLPSTGGYRSNEEQARLYAKGRTPSEIANRIKKQGRGGSVTDAPPGSSAHNYGLAIDIEGRDQRLIIDFARWLGFGTVSWDPAHLEYPGWAALLTRRS